MDIRSAFPSKYLSAVDLAQFPTRSIRVTIAKVAMETMKTRDRGDEEKAILYFKNAQKGLVLNKTNANTIAHAYGFDTAQWVGQVVELFTAEVEAFGEMVDAIRVRIPKAQPATPRTNPELSRQAEPMPSNANAEGFESRPASDEDIPF